MIIFIDILSLIINNEMEFKIILHNAFITTSLYVRPSQRMHSHMLPYVGNISVINIIIMALHCVLRRNGNQYPFHMLEGIMLSLWNVLCYIMKGIIYTLYENLMRIANIPYVCLKAGRKVNNRICWLCQSK